MKQIITQLTVISVIIACMCTACEKYPKGGIVNRGDKNLVNVWRLKSLSRDGVDLTDSVRAREYKEEYTQNGFVTRTFLVGTNNDDTVCFSQNFEWSSDYKYITNTIAGDSTFYNYPLYLNNMQMITSPALMSVIMNIGKTTRTAEDVFVDQYWQKIVIKKLKKKELWYTIDWDGHIYEFHLKPNT